MQRTDAGVPRPPARLRGQSQPPSWGRASFRSWLPGFLIKNGAAARTEVLNWEAKQPGAEGGADLHGRRLGENFHLVPTSVANTPTGGRLGWEGAWRAGRGWG